MLITLWDTVFPGVPIPNQIAYVQAIDFSLDRMETMTNVIGDTIIARVVQAMEGPISEEELEKLDRETDERWMRDLLTKQAKRQAQGQDSLRFRVPPLRQLYR